MSEKNIPITVLFLFSILLGACSPLQAPLQVAVSPKITPIARFPPSQVISYQAFIELNVANVDRSASRAVQLTVELGGYQANSHSWYIDGRKHTSLELLVPSLHFESLRLLLLELGDLVRQSVFELPNPAYPRDERAVLSTITLQLNSAGYVLPPVRIGAWHPLNTLRRAFAVFLSIFGFLADILIWLVVVAGPFILLGAVVYWLMRRLRRLH